MSVTAKMVVVRHIFHTFPQTADCLLYHSRTFIPDGSVALTQDSQQLQPNWNAADAKKGDFSEVVWRADGSHHSTLYCTVKTSCCCEAVCLCSTSTACREKKHFKPYFGSKLTRLLKSLLSDLSVDSTFVVSTSRWPLKVKLSLHLYSFRSRRGLARLT